MIFHSCELCHVNYKTSNIKKFLSNLVNMHVKVFFPSFFSQLIIYFSCLQAMIYLGSSAVAQVLPPEGTRSPLHHYQACQGNQNNPQYFPKKQKHNILVTAKKMKRRIYIKLSKCILFQLSVTPSRPAFTFSFNNFSMKNIAANHVESILSFNQRKFS